MQYFKLIIEGHCEGKYFFVSGNLRFDEDEDFWTATETIFSNSYLHKYLNGDKQKLELQNSFEAFHLAWQVLSADESKTMKKKYQILCKNREDVEDIFSPENDEMSEM